MHVYLLLVLDITPGPDLTRGRLTFTEHLQRASASGDLYGFLDLAQEGSKDRTPSKERQLPAAEAARSSCTNKG